MLNLENDTFPPVIGQLVYVTAFKKPEFAIFLGDKEATDSTNQPIIGCWVYLQERCEYAWFRRTQLSTIRDVQMWDMLCG